MSYAREARIFGGILLLGTAVAVTAVFTRGYWRVAGNQPQKITCLKNLSQIGLAITTWSLDHGDRLPFQVSTNAGGSLELCPPGGGGFISNSAPHFQLMSNELATPLILVCPKDTSRTPASDFASLRSGNVSYLLRCGPSSGLSNRADVFAVCPVDGNTLYSDGTVRKGVQP